MQKWILPIAVVLVLTACHKKEDEDLPTPVTVTVRTAKAEAGTLQLSVKAPATIFPHQQANVTARFTAPIRVVKVKKGDEVRANQVLAILESRDLGTFLQIWETLQDQRAELRGNLAKAEADLERLKDSKEPKELERARNQERYIHAQLTQNNAQLEVLEIRSPFDGSITEQFQYPGDMARPESPAFTVMDLSVLTGRAQVPEAEVGRIRNGVPCQFTPIEGGAKPSIGRVTMINRAVDPQRRTVEVWCEVSNPGHKLRAGIFGEVKIVTGQSSGVLVPETAVQFSLGTRKGFVIVVDAGRTTHRREVETGEAQDGKVQILKGLNAGETVVIEGGYGLPDDTTVTLESHL